MKSNLTKLSLALLSAVFVLGCQDVGSGPVGPDGPQFNSPFSGPCTERHCHGEDADVEASTYRISFTVDSDIFGVNAVGDPISYDTNGLGHVVVEIFKMDITVLLQEGWGVTCGGPPLPVVVDPEAVVADKVILTGRFNLTPFANPALHLSFEHNGAAHYVQSLSDSFSDMEAEWYPTVIGPKGAVTVKDLNGQWKITTTGKNHRFGCTGEGGPDTKNPDNTINWTAKVTRIS